jgi:hypothetical protein
MEAVVFATLTCRPLHQVRPASEASANGLLIRLEASDEPPRRQVPAHVAVALDASGSMDGAIREAVEGISRLARSLGRDDRLAVVAFGESKQTVLPLSLVPSPQRIADALRRLACAGTSSLRVGVEAALEQLAHAPTGASQGHVVLVTDTRSVSGGRALAGLAGVVEALRAARVPAHAIGIGPDTDHATLLDLALLTGGELRFADTPGDLPQELDGLGASIAGAATGPVNIEVTPLRRNAVRSAGGQGALVLPPMVTGEARGVFLELEHEPRPEGAYVVASVAARALDLRAGAPATAVAEAEVNFRDEAPRAEPDASVLCGAVAADAARASRRLLEGLRNGTLPVREGVAGAEGVASLLRAAGLDLLAETLPLPTKARRWEGWHPNRALAHIVHFVTSGRAIRASAPRGSGPDQRGG